MLFVFHISVICCVVFLSFPPCLYSFSILISILLGIVLFPSVPPSRPRSLTCVVFIFLIFISLSCPHSLASPSLDFFRNCIFNPSTLPFYVSSCKSSLSSSSFIFSISLFLISNSPSYTFLCLFCIPFSNS